MRTQLKLAAGAIATAGLIALPASASAAGAGTPVADSPFTVTVSSPFAACYTSLPAADKGPVISVPLTGGTPGDAFEITASTKGEEDGSGDGTFDTNGDATVSLGPIIPTFSSAGPVSGVPTTVTVMDETTDVTQTVGSFLVTQIGVSVASTPRNPRLAREVAVSGVFPSETNYGFVTNSKGTKILRKFSLGVANSCGYVKKKEVVVPADFALGTYRFYIYNKPQLDKTLALPTKFKIYQR